MNAALLGAARQAIDRRLVLPTAGLVALYDFVQGADPQVLYDQTGNGYNGQLGSQAAADSADPTWTSKGLVFDGTNDTVKGPVIPGGSVSGLTYIAVTSIAPGGAEASILDNKVSSSNNPGMALQVSAAGDAVVRISNGSTQVNARAGAGKVATNSPQFLAAVTNRQEGRAKVFLNGELINSVAFPVGWDISSPNPLYMASYGTAGYMTGTIHSVAIYGRGLSDTEIQRAYRALRRTLTRRNIFLT